MSSIRTTIDSFAFIDRRIELLEGPDNQKSLIRRVSDLRKLPFVVLLGEPGIGKSTVLKNEAAEEGASLTSVRELITGNYQSTHKPLYLDALDEYRTEGDRSEKWSWSWSSPGLMDSYELTDSSRSRAFFS